MPVDLVAYRDSAAEQVRIADAMRLLPKGQRTVLDVGALDGHISKLLTAYYESVTALDLTAPVISHDRITCVQGDVTALQYPDDTFDTVVCLEVLEHVSPSLLAAACAELVRVTRHHVVVGVPCHQDLRIGRSTCCLCGALNPPWGHVSSFDEAKLRGLFVGADIEELSFVGSETAVMNPLAASLMDFAGNPYGIYSQDQPCVACGAGLQQPPPRRFAQRVSTRLASWALSIQRPFVRPSPLWVHARLNKTVQRTHQRVR